jgi:hypothetical protein
MSIIYAVLIFFIPLCKYRLYGHVLEASAALICMGCCLYAYLRWSHRVIMVLAAFAFGGYALSTIFWYSHSLLLGRDTAFLSVAELGFLGFIFFLIAGIRMEFDVLPSLRPYFTCVMVLVCTAITTVVAVSLGITFPALLLAVRLCLTAYLIGLLFLCGIFSAPLLALGISLRCAVSILYGVREVIFPYTPEVCATGPGPFTAYNLLSIVGPVVVAAFALIVLGLLDYIAKQEHAR